MSLSDGFSSPRHSCGYLAASSSGISAWRKNPIIWGFGKMSCPILNALVPMLVAKIDSHDTRTTSPISRIDSGWSANSLRVTFSHFSDRRPLYGELIIKYPPKGLLPLRQEPVQSQQCSIDLHFVLHVLLLRRKFYATRRRPRVPLGTSLPFCGNCEHVHQ